MANPDENSSGTSLIINLIKDLIIEFKADSNVTAVILTGSYTNKTHQPYSDVDITVFYKDLSQSGLEYDLRYYNDTLVSITSSDISTWENNLKNAKILMMSYKAIKDSIVLFDRKEEFKKFKSNLTQTPWVYAEADRRERMDRLAIGYIEEVHKLLNMLVEFDESTTANALNALCLGMAELMALHHKLLFQSENEYFELIQSSVGWNSKWTQLFRDVFNLQLVGEHKTIDMKITTGLLLYSETVSTVNLSDVALKKITKTLKLINLQILKPS